MLLSHDIVAKEMHQSLDIGFNSSEIDTLSGSGFDIGWSANIVFPNNLSLGFSCNYGNADIDENLFHYYGGDIKLGYNYKRLTPYIIGSGIYQSYYKKEAAGFGYGVGLEFLLFSHLALAIEYRDYSMVSEINEYDFKSTKAFLKILF